MFNAYCEYVRGYIEVKSAVQYVESEYGVHFEADLIAASGDVAACALPNNSNESKTGPSENCASFMRNGLFWFMADD